MTVRVLHVDDEPDIREVVNLALGLDPDLSVQSCASGGDALMTAAEWLPDIILLDVMMPGMDGPATLLRLRESPQTAGIPVIFMTARAQAREVQHFVSLGAEAVISKPFDPMVLATSVRKYMCPAAGDVAERRENFIARTRLEASALRQERVDLADGARAPAALRNIVAIAHSLAAGANVADLQHVRSEAISLERVARTELAGTGSPAAVEGALDVLIATVENL
jgi:CheY-like chemotaxis protein